MRKKLFMAMAIVLSLAMIGLTGCGDEQAKAPEANTIGDWDLSTEQEDTLDKTCMLLDANGTFLQFNTGNANMRLIARHYKNGKLVKDEDQLDFLTSGNGYMYIDYSADTGEDLYGDFVEPDYADALIGQVKVSVMSDMDEDAGKMEFDVDGYGNESSMMSMLSSDDTWDTGTSIDIPYGEEFLLWGVDLSDGEGSGDIAETVSGTVDKWKEGECILIYAIITEQTASDDENTDTDTQSEDNYDVDSDEDYADEDLTPDEEKAMLEDIEKQENN